MDMDHTLQNAGCFYVENASGNEQSKIVFIFITRKALTILLRSYSADNINAIQDIPKLGICDVSCDFNISDVLSGICSSHDKLVSLVQGRRTVCMDEVSVNVRVTGDIVTISLNNANLPIDTNIQSIYSCQGKSINLLDYCYKN